MATDMISINYLAYPVKSIDVEPLLGFIDQLSNNCEEIEKLSLCDPNRQSDISERRIMETLRIQMSPI